MDMKGDKIINFRDVNKATSVNRSERSNPLDLSVKNIFANKKIEEAPSQSFVGKLSENKVRKLDLNTRFFESNPLDNFEI